MANPTRHHRQFEIEFDNDNTVFTPGSLVTGRVKIDLHSPTPLRTVQLLATGVGQTRWIKNAYEFCQAVRIYLDLALTLWSSDADYEHKGGPMPAGVHTFPFKFALPDYCPSSFENDEFGNIRYGVEAIVHTTGFHLHHSVKQSIRVSRPVDLNTKAAASSPVKNSSQSKATSAFWCLPASKEVMTMTVSLPQLGYVPGELLQLKVEVRGNGPSAVQLIEFDVEQRTTFAGLSTMTSEAASREEIESVAAGRKSGAEFGRLAPGEKGKHLFRMRLPPLPPSQTASECDIIQIDYVVNVKLIFAGWFSSPIQASVPIVVGTIPLRKKSVAEESTAANEEKRADSRELNLQKPKRKHKVKRKVKRKQNQVAPTQNGEETTEMKGNREEESRNLREENGEASMLKQKESTQNEEGMERKQNQEEEKRELPLQNEKQLPMETNEVKQNVGEKVENPIKQSHNTEKPEDVAENPDDPIQSSHPPTKKAALKVPKKKATKCDDATIAEKNQKELVENGGLEPIEGAKKGQKKRKPKSKVAPKQESDEKKTPMTDVERDSQPGQKPKLKDRADEQRNPDNTAGNRNV